jgi:hypothetical protein
MYRITLYIVPEQDEDDTKEDFSSSFVDKDLLSSNNGYWWDTVKGDGGRVTVTHRANKAKVKVAFSESQQDKGHETGRCREQRNNRANKKNKVRQRLSSVALVTWRVAWNYSYIKRNGCLLELKLVHKWLTCVCACGRGEGCIYTHT